MLFIQTAEISLESWLNTNCDYSCREYTATLSPDDPVENGYRWMAVSALLVRTSERVMALKMKMV